MGKHKKDKEEKKSKKSKSKKDKKHKSKSDKKHDRKKEDKITQASSRNTHTTRPLITEDDFFLKNEHFRVWCNLIKNISFESLSSEEASKLFSKDFCKQYNHNELPDMFYKEEIPSEVRDNALKSKHNWNFKVSKDEAVKLTSIADDVDFKTRHITEGAWNHMKLSAASNTASITADRHGLTHTITTTPYMPPPPTTTYSSSSSSSSSAYASGNNYNSNNSSNNVPTRDDRHQKVLEEDNRRDDIYKQKQYDKRKTREHHQELLDEYAPKETGRLAVQDKRKGMSAEFHAAAREREESRDGLDMNERDIMGGGDDFESVKARLNRNQTKRDQYRQERLHELQQKEDEKNRVFMSQLGVDLSKGPIKIIPRNNSS